MFDGYFFNFNDGNNIKSYIVLPVFFKDITFGYCFYSLGFAFVHKFFWETIPRTCAVFHFYKNKDIFIFRNDVYLGSAMPIIELNHFQAFGDQIFSCQLLALLS